ncbi:MAG: hypothetical protein SFU86_20780 [Pirellulaceae bacterium]|nr:hypothetical protein [Pirellulaceae bacterium]
MSDFPADRRRTLRPPQFGLRTLLLTVTACAVLFALARWFSPITVAGVILLALSIAAHVAGNAIGTRLRDIGNEPSLPPRSGSPQPRDFAPVTRLGQKSSLGWPIVFGTGAGALLSGIGGGVWTLASGTESVGPLNVAVGIIAFGVLGGIGTFVVFGFVQVAIGAIRQALRHSDPPTSP